MNGDGDDDHGPGRSILSSVFLSLRVSLCRHERNERREVGKDGRTEGGRNGDPWLCAFVRSCVRG